MTQTVAGGVERIPDCASVLGLFIFPSKAKLCRHALLYLNFLFHGFQLGTVMNVIQNKHYLGDALEKFLLIIR